MYAEKPGMGVEPIYSGSAGRRLNGSATPAANISFCTLINRLSATFKLLADLSVNVQSRFFVLDVLYQHPSAGEEAYFKAFVVEY